MVADASSVAAESRQRRVPLAAPSLLGRMRSVSYTHLDVYKRQVVHRGLERRRLPVRTKTQSDLLGSAVGRYT